MVLPIKKIQAQASVDVPGVGTLYCEGDHQTIGENFGDAYCKCESGYVMSSSGQCVSNSFTNDNSISTPLYTEPINRTYTPDISAMLKDLDNYNSCHNPDPHSFYNKNTGKCACSYQYSFDVNGKCSCPINSVEDSHGSCIPNTGYVNDGHGKIITEKEASDTECKKEFGQNSTTSPNKHDDKNVYCSCNEGYTFDTTGKKQCVLIPIAPVVSSSTSVINPPNDLNVEKKEIIQPKPKIKKVITPISSLSAKQPLITIKTDTISQTNPEPVKSKWYQKVFNWLKFW